MVNLFILLKWTICSYFLFPIVFILFASITYAHNVKRVICKQLAALVYLGFCLALCVSCLVGLMVCVSTSCLSSGSHKNEKFEQLHKYPCKIHVCDFLIFSFFFPLWGYPESRTVWMLTKKWELRYLSVLLGFTCLCSPWSPQTASLFPGRFKLGFIP